MEWIDNDLMDQFRGAQKCEWCGKPTPYGADPHHLRGRGTGGGSRLDLRFNLIALDWRCHRCEIPAGNIIYIDLLAKVAVRENVGADIIRSVVDELRDTHVAACDKAEAIVEVYARHGLPSPLATGARLA